MKRKISRQTLLTGTFLGLSLLGCKKAQVSLSQPETNVVKTSNSFAANVSGPQLIIPVNPNLTGAIAHLTSSSDYKVELKLSTSSTWLPAFVYRTDNYAPSNNADNNPNERRLENSASFLNFSYTAGATVNVKVTVNNSAITGNVIIRPLSYNITTSQSVGSGNSTIYFNVSNYRKISVEVGNRLNPLFIFTDAPETDPGAGAVTHYFAAGTSTNIGLKGITLHSNDKVYIAGGAVVQGTFLYDKGATNVQFSGHGVLTSGTIPHPDNNPTNLFKYATFAGAATSNEASNCGWEGITMVNGAAYTFSCVSSYANVSHDNHWTDIKEVNWNANTDALWFDGQHNRASDLFFFCNDDVTTHGSTDFQLNNMVYWQGSNGGHLFMHNNYYSSDGITYDNIDVIGNDQGRQMIRYYGDQGNLGLSCKNVTFQNIRVENTRNISNASTFWTNHFLDITPQGDNQANYWTFKNITFYSQHASIGTGTEEGTIYGTYNQNISTNVNHIHFINFVVPNHNPCFSLGNAEMANNGYTSDVTFTQLQQ